MSLKHGLMGLLNQKPMTGYDLDKLFNASLVFFWPAQYSQIYSELDKMEKKGWLTSQRVIQEDKPNKRIYTLTPAGKGEFLGWLSTTEIDLKSSFSIKSEFLMRLFFAGYASKAQVLEMLRALQDACYARRTDYEKVKESIIEDGDDEYVQLTALYGEMANETRLAWVEKAINHIEKMEEK
ncbi:MAG: PadR family transcriptional regulator [Defluviitaleaceae bacterium]|nr:PadR family transcriptional regulator [Defluviitaleaceae bacterium]MCL2273382.1 PadR family transcriptional regulator [Defluviitaleaceae bacterium]